MFRKILVGVDDSQQASWAVELAGKMAAESGAQVALIHVVDAPVGYVPDFGFAEVRVVTELREAAEGILERAAAQLEHSVNVRRVVREGPPADEIVGFAQEWGADVIVLGTHGRGVLAHLLIGSCAEAVVRRAPCPVLTVRQKVAEPAQPETAGHA